MKVFFYFYILSIFCLYACGDPAKNESATQFSVSGILIDDSPFVKDTAKINDIDSVCLSTNKAMFHKPKHHIIDVTHLGQPNLKIGYYINPESGVTRLLISENEDRILNLKYFYYKNNIPIQMHYRYWDKNPNPQFTEETYMYFDENGKMFYAGERSAEIFEGEIPAKLKDIDLTVPEKSKKELYDFAIKYWELSKPLVDQDMAAEAKTGQ